ncbi:hypothetical protein [Paenibacillus guangzhouensis]|uniref:hypothetical protein n=1 Tax=Paenibacillus guangzhouensis TaxID=1473112 RepID=UPI00187B7541|nr:hypothetical protein [Paenibacillus guangzhouensis]
MMLILTGCASDPGKRTPVNKEALATITLTPVDLFSGSAAKFKPFLGNMSGAFKLRYDGKRPKASLDIDVWKDGKKAASSGSIGDLFFSPSNEENREVDIIISIDTDTSFDASQKSVNKIKVSIQHDAGYTATTFTTPWDSKLSARGLIDYAEPRTFSTNGPIHVWGMQATSNNMIRTADFSPESLQRLEAALIFTLRFEDQ